jgi:hypothetical protein
MLLFFFDFFDYLESFIFMVKVPLSLGHGAPSCGGQRRRRADMEGRCEYTEKVVMGFLPDRGEVEVPYIKKRKIRCTYLRVCERIL